MQCAHFVKVCLIEAAFSACLDGCKGCVKSFYFIIYSFIVKKKGKKKKEKKISETMKVLVVAARPVQAQLFFLFSTEAKLLFIILCSCCSPFCYPPQASSCCCSATGLKESFVLMGVLCVSSLLQGLNQVRRMSLLGPDGVRRTDWHDYEAMRKDSARSGGRGFPHKHTPKSFF